MLTALALLASTVLGVGLVVALTVLLAVVLPTPPEDFGTPAERHERRLDTYRSNR